MANLYEKFDKIDEAEETYKKVTELNPKDAKACGALAALLQQAALGRAGRRLGGGRARARAAPSSTSRSTTLERCADLDPTDATGYYKVAIFYWDKAYRDPLLSDAAEGRPTPTRASRRSTRRLEIKPDYWEAIIYKGLLYRVKAAGRQEPDGCAQQFLEQAADAPEAGHGAAQGAAGRPSGGAGSSEPGSRRRAAARGGRTQ